MKKIYIFALVAMLFAACATDAIDEQSVKVEEQTPDTLVGTFEGDDSRIQLQNGKTVWTKGDEVSVFYLSNANQKWQYQGETGERTGNLKRIANADGSQEMSSVVVVYPYNENYYINHRTCNVKASLPATQTYLKDSYGLDGNIMVSQSEYNQFSLKNVCGWLKVQLIGSGDKVQSIKLKGNNGEQVAGEIYINSADATSTLASEMGGADDGENSAGGNLVFDDTILTEVVLNCGEGVTLSSEPTAFYIALPPQTFEKGLTIEILVADGSTMTKSTTNAITIERNCIQPMTSLAYEGVIPEVFELAYTTNDGEPLDPYTTEGFGANFVENVYDAATGRGALKFDGKITTIPEKAFIACGNLTHINLPIGITAINAEAFNGCGNLTHINLPIGITAINAEAFSGCGKLTIMDIPQGVKTIGNKAFYNCSGVSEITIPSSVTSIGKSSFEGCGGKANINCKIARVSSEKEGYFYNAEFTEIIIGNSVTSIGALAFYDCDNLTTITIPDSVTKIGQNAFGGCKALSRVNAANLSAWCKISFDFVSKFDNGAAYYLTTNPLYYADLYIDGIEVIDIIIPSDVTEIKGSAFIGCDSFVKVVMHNDITSIGEYAFYNCSNLTSITISNSITSIKTNTFSGCSSLTNVTIPDSVTEIGDAAFSSCSSLTSVTIPNRVTSIGGAIFYGCSSLTAFYGKFASADNRCLIIDGVLNSFAPAGLTEYTIPDNVTKIGVRAFRNCSSLTGVTIPDSVTSIGWGAFEDCTSLKEVYCKPTTPPTGDSDMFHYNASGRKIYVPTASVEPYKAAKYWSNYVSYIEGYDF